MWNWGQRRACPCAGAVLLPAEVAAEQLIIRVLLLTFCFVVLATFLKMLSFSHE